jgi:hypothetical protein
VTALDINVVVLQILLPLALLGGFAARPLQHALGYWLQLTATSSTLIALCLVVPWLVPPWWVSRAYLAALGLAFLGHALRRRIPRRPAVPRGARGWAPVVLLALLAMATGLLDLGAIAGRRTPDGDRVDLAFPLGAGTYLVATGGAHEIVNGHFLTLDPKTERQRAYRGQSYGVDLVEIDRFGLRASGWRPQDPAAYRIFGRPVLAPCAGPVLIAEDGMRDMPVPERDPTRLEGNHVFLDCGGVGVLLAHLQQGSVRVRAGDQVTRGDLLGRVGNSGQTGEPHLHVHAQRLAGDDAPFSGEPLFLTFEGRFPVRNDRLRIAGP